MAAASALYACGSYAINVFAAAFLIRVHGLSTTRAGLAFGLAFGFAGRASTFLSDVISDALSQRDPRRRQLLPAIGQLLSFPTALGAWLVPDVRLSLALLALTYVLGLTYYVQTFAAAQHLARESERATASALLQFCPTFIGSSPGPIAADWASERLAPQPARFRCARHCA